MKLFLVRHAEGENSRTHWQSPDTPLSSLGIKQAKALVATKRFNTVDRVFSSSLARSRQTADIIARDLNKTVEENVDIREREQSSQIYGLDRTDTISERYVKALQENTNDWNYKWDNEEESKNEVRSRVINFKKYLEANFSEDNILVISHENFLKQLLNGRGISGSD